MGVVLIHIRRKRDKALFKSDLSHMMDFITRKDLREKYEHCHVEENYFSVPTGRQESYHQMSSDYRLTSLPQFYLSTHLLLMCVEEKK